jgi:hypothetical protein
MTSRLIGLRLARAGHNHPAGYHKRDKRQAHEALAILGSANRRKLTAADKTRADDRARTVFGGRRYAPWLCVCTAMAGSFRKGWISDDFFREVVVPTVNKGLSAVAALKC